MGSCSFIVWVLRNAEMEISSGAEMETREMIKQFSSSSISTYIGLLGLLAGSLSLILIILCLAWSARRTKPEPVVESEVRGEHSCQIYVLEPPPPYSSLADWQQQPPSYHSAVRVISNVKQSEEDDSWSRQ